METKPISTTWLHSDLLMGVLRGYQIDALNMISKYINSRSQKQSLIKMPTGTGKTLLIGCTASNNVRVKNILIVTPSQAIRDQLYIDIKERIWDKFKIPKTKKKYRSFTKVHSKGVRTLTVQFLLGL